MPRQRLRALYRWPVEGLAALRENDASNKTAAGIYLPPFFCLMPTSHKGRGSQGLLNSNYLDP